MRNRIIAILLVMLGGCPEDDPPPMIVVDLPGKDPDGSAGFLDRCERDQDCASGICLTLGAEKRCNRSCSTSSPCPSGKNWSCNTSLVCECAYTGKKPTLCNVDGDCDGELDRPIKKETCNNEDDDCNGILDDVAPQTAGAKKYYFDKDEDTYGDDNNTKWLCKPETGWVEKGGDCNDDRSDVHPDQEEICGDTYDNDCDGKKEDPDVCGRIPIEADLEKGLSSELKVCPKSSTIEGGLDISEILGKQDSSALKFTVRLKGKPVLDSCASYTIHFGDSEAYNLVYIYRPGAAKCESTMPSFEAYYKGEKINTTMNPAFNIGDQVGHISFVIEKAELFPKLPSPSYMLKACTNKASDAVKDITICQTDSCAVPVHR